LLEGGTKFERHADTVSSAGAMLLRCCRLQEHVFETLILEHYFWVAWVIRRPHAPAEAREHGTAFLLSDLRVICVIRG